MQKMTNTVLVMISVLLLGLTAPACAQGGTDDGPVPVASPAAGQQAGADNDAVAPAPTVAASPSAPSQPAAQRPTSPPSRGAVATNAPTRRPSQADVSRAREMLRHRGQESLGVERHRELWKEFHGGGVIGQGEIQRRIDKAKGEAQAYADKGDEATLAAAMQYVNERIGDLPIVAWAALILAIIAIGLALLSFLSGRRRNDDVVVLQGNQPGVLQGDPPRVVQGPQPVAVRN